MTVRNRIMSLENNNDNEKNFPMIKWRWLLSIYLYFTESRELLFYAGCFWGFPGLSCVSNWWVIDEPYWDHLFSVLLEAQSLLLSIIFLSILIMSCLPKSKVELWAELLVFSSPCLSWTYDYFCSPGDAESLSFLIFLSILAFLPSEFGLRKSERNLIEKT